MTLQQLQVLQFMIKFGQEVPSIPTVPDRSIQQLRTDLIGEELWELEAAFGTGDLVGIADAIADLLYVVYGCANACGIDMDHIFREVHDANMRKLGGHKREDGKWMKPDGWQPPDKQIFLQLNMQAESEAMKGFRDTCIAQGN